MKLAQYLYIWVNESTRKTDMICYQCGKDLTYKNHGTIPPIIITRKANPYCSDCAWKMGFLQKLGVVKHA